MDRVRKKKRRERKKERERREKEGGGEGEGGKGGCLLCWAWQLLLLAGRLLPALFCASVHLFAAFACRAPSKFSKTRFPFSLAQASPSYKAKSPRPAASSGARQSRRCRCEAPYEAARPARLEVKAACVKRAGLYRGPAKAAEVWLWGRSQQRNLSQ